MPHVVVDVDADVPAERMMAAATDFSERRPELWPNISREFWKLHDQGPSWAEATEGSPTVWARERYEWSENRVVGTTQDSNVWQPGEPGRWKSSRAAAAVTSGWSWTDAGRGGLALLHPGGPLRPTDPREESPEDFEPPRVQS
jgi:hypothetical protein